MRRASSSGSLLGLTAAGGSPNVERLLVASLVLNAVLLLTLLRNSPSPAGLATNGSLRGSTSEGFGYDLPSHSALSASEPEVVCEPEDNQACTCEDQSIGRSTFVSPPWRTPNVTSFWDLTASLGGRDLPLRDFRAKAALVVNIASA
mmetsp:Transcript_11569/g.42314  ORF Transcript_11569/g.42314 Transcript_11569/m.42314 type:complete len:147 (-) Transcript_11569:1544-1984(-)